MAGYLIRINVHMSCIGRQCIEATPNHDASPIIDHGPLSSKGALVAVKQVTVNVLGQDGALRVVSIFGNVREMQVRDLVHVHQESAVYCEQQ